MMGKLLINEILPKLVFYRPLFRLNSCVMPSWRWMQPACFLEAL